MWKRRLWRGLLWIILLSMMGIIFGFSAQDASASEAVSEVFAAPLARLLSYMRGGLEGAEYARMYRSAHLFVRKAAHFTEYALLGLTITLLMGSYRLRARWGFLAWALGTLYAVTDELHQLSSYGRAGQWQDVALDSSGVLLGVLVATLINRKHNCHKKTTKPEASTRRKSS